MEANTVAPSNAYELAASEQLALLSLALKASVECLDGLAAMNVALSRTLEESAQQISASQALIKRISRLANLDAKMASLPTQHSSELQAILLATNEDFSSAVDFNAWKGRLNISNLADSFQAAQGAAEPLRADAADTAKGGNETEQGKPEEGGH
jgi:hypothetical protein